MAKEEEVERFLRDFKVKMKIWNILFRDERGKNSQSLLDLGLRPIERKEIIEELQLSDYSEGPIVDQLYKGSDMWVFGVEFKSNEIYIKITLGYSGAQVICISFHEAEYPMNYPFR